MPLVKATQQSCGPFGNPDHIGYVSSSVYSGSGSVVLMPVCLGRFDTTQTINFGDRLIFFYRFLIPRTTTISGVSIAFTATTAFSRSVTSITESSGVATATSTAHGYSLWDRVRISGATPSAYNSTFLITSVPTADTFTFAIANGTGTASGTIFARDFIGCAIYDYNKTNLLPNNKLTDCAIIPSSSNVVTSFSSNIILPGGMVWVGIGGSRRNTNSSLATIVMTAENSTLVNTHLFGMKTGDFSQYRGGIGIGQYDNSGTSVGNSGFPSQVTAGSAYGSGVGIYSDASAGSTWLSKIPMLGLVVF